MSSIDLSSRSDNGNTSAEPSNAELDHKMPERTTDAAENRDIIMHCKKPRATDNEVVDEGEEKFLPLPTHLKPLTSNAFRVARKHNHDDTGGFDQEENQELQNNVRELVRPSMQPLRARQHVLDAVRRDEPDHQDWITSRKDFLNAVKQQTALIRSEASRKVEVGQTKAAPPDKEECMKEETRESDAEKLPSKEVGS